MSGRNLPASRQGHAFSLGRIPQGGAQIRVMGGGHRDKTGIGFLADQRIKAGEIDVITQQHQIARAHIRAERACGIGGACQRNHSTLGRHLGHLQTSARAVGLAFTQRIKSMKALQLAQPSASPEAIQVNVITQQTPTCGPTEAVVRVLLGERPPALAPPRDARYQGRLTRERRRGREFEDAQAIR